MEIAIDKKKEMKPSPANDLTAYRESIRKVMVDELRNALDEEVQKAARELVEEQRKAIRQILDEHKAAIRQVVEEEKKTIWEKAESLRQSILKFGI
jgi:uncharacterized membrane protein